MAGHKGSSTMTLEDMKAVASFGETLEELAKQDSNGDHYLSGDIRIWNKNGWSPGFFRFEDDWIVFHADYKEETS